MAAKDLTKTTIERELSLLIDRVSKTTEIDTDYQSLILLNLEMVEKCLNWEILGIPYEVFVSN